MERLASGRIRMQHGQDDIPANTEVQEIDGQLWFFFPDGTVWVHVDTDENDICKLVRITVH